MMNKDLSDLTPLRKMSGRRSKPSMDLLVDNQRVLPQYVSPKKEIHNTNLRHHLDSTSLSNNPEKSPISLKVKTVPKSHKKQILIKSKVALNTSKVLGIKKKLVTLNGSNKVKTDTSEEILNQTPYVTLRLDKIDFKDSVMIKEVEDVSNKEDDDLPLAKIFPDFKPEETGEAVTRIPLVVPPKKKIKFVNINQLNGVLNKPTTLSAFKNSHISPKLHSDSTNSVTEEKTIIVKVLSPTTSPSKIDILTMAKIPKIQKKVKINGTTDIVHLEKSPPEEVHDLKIMSDVPNLLDENSPSPPRIHKEAARKCVRLKCTNVAIDDFRWDKEFCSPDCAIVHSKYLLQEWLSQHYPEPISEMHI